MQDKLLEKLATLLHRAVPKQLKACPLTRMVPRAHVVSTVPRLSVINLRTRPLFKIIWV